MPKHRVPTERREKAQQLRRNSTDAEQKLWTLLRSRQLDHIKFRRQVPLGPWVVDFVSFAHRLIIEGTAVNTRRASAISAAMPT